MARNFLQRGINNLRSPQAVKWCKPPLNSMKVNCDASVRDNGFVGIGFVVHNSLGDVFGAGIDHVMLIASRPCLSVWE